MAHQIEGKRTAFIATDGVQRDELEGAVAGGQEAGGTPEPISMKGDAIQAARGDAETATFPVDRTFDDTSPGAYDALPAFNRKLIEKSPRASTAGRGRLRL
jgi:deglycase